MNENESKSFLFPVRAELRLNGCLDHQGTLMYLWIWRLSSHFGFALMYSIISGITFEAFSHSGCK
jgi:hypothetical protein